MFGNEQSDLCRNDCHPLILPSLASAQVKYRRQASEYILATIYNFEVEEGRQ